MESNDSTDEEDCNGRLYVTYPACHGYKYKENSENSHRHVNSRASDRCRSVPVGFEREDDDDNTSKQSIISETNDRFGQLSSQSETRKSCPNLVNSKRHQKPPPLLYYKRTLSCPHHNNDWSQYGKTSRTLSNASGHVEIGFDRRCQTPDPSTSFGDNSLPAFPPYDSESESESSDDTETTKTGFFRSLTRRQACILGSMALSDFSCYVCLSLLSPFFPLEATNRGISTTTSGWIFGIFALVQVVCSPIAGRLMNSTGARFMFLSGLFFAAGCNALFGVLDWVPVDDGGTVFIIMCFIIRVFLALGCTAYTTASFALCATEFDDAVTTVFGILETVIGVGMMVGPALGGVLYQAGGFSLPFLVTGAFMMAVLPVTFFLLPQHDETVETNTEEVKPSLLFKNIGFYVICFDVTVSAIIWSVLDPLLEPHLEVFNLSTDIIGLLFLLMSGVYAVLAPVWGWVADRMVDSKPLLVLGFLLAGVGMFLLGPTPFFGLDPDYNELWLNIVALIVLGMSVSLASVPTFDAIICIAEDVGLPDNLGTYGLIAGLWSSAFALGDFIGPSFGGSIQDAVGFPWTITFVGLLSGFAGLLTMALYLFERCWQRAKTDYTEQSGEYDDEETAKETTPLIPGQSHQSEAYCVPITSNVIDKTENSC